MPPLCRGSTDAQKQPGDQGTLHVTSHWPHQYAYDWLPRWLQGQYALFVGESEAYLCSDSTWGSMFAK